jgi:hypothetical protein
MAPPADLTTIPDTGDMGSPSPFQFSPSSLSFGSVVINSKAATVLKVQVTNDELIPIYGVQIPPSSSSDGLTVQSETCTSARMMPSCSVTVAFAPTKVGKVNTTLSFSTPGGTVHACAITGEGTLGQAALTVDTKTLDFGDVNLDNQANAVLVLTVTNSGAVAASGVTTALDPADQKFSVETGHWDGCGAPLPAGTNCKLYVRFAPTAVGNYSATLKVQAGTIEAAPVAVKGHAIDPAVLQVTPVGTGTFDSEFIGQTSPAVKYKVSNSRADTSGAISVSITTGDGSTPDFAVDDSDCKGKTLATGASCVLSVTFTPSKGGLRTATLKVSAMPGTPANQLISASGKKHSSLTLFSGTGDFGTVDDPAFGVHDLTFLNDGDDVIGPMTPTFAQTSNGALYKWSGGNCDGQTMQPHATCILQIAFAPKMQGPYQDKVTLSGAGADPVSVALSGTFTSAATLRVLPAPVYFDPSYTRDPITTDVQIWNTTTNDIGPLTTALSGGDDKFFAIADGATPCAAQTLHGGDRCSLKATFTPQYSGSYSTTLNVTAGASAASATLSAYAHLPSLSFTPAQVDFGTVPIAPISVTVTVTNLSLSPVPTTNFFLLGSSFWVINNCPTMLPPTAGNNTCTLTVGFRPNMAGTYIGKITFPAIYNDAQSVLLLTGTAQ